ncbi:hypothetical protein D3C87_1809390 [compost metagenome]
MPAKPSGIWLNLPIRRPAIANADKDGSLRSSKGFSIVKMTAALGILTMPLTESPGKATTLSTPGSARAISDIFLTTASVRSSEAPVGNWAMPTR